ncbi:uncharacterized protein LOC131428922 [Malaya genurostris]|uniref:uncharacterized protein LOC131428922 n=1 Tax=Malaya genurostris TaxID=325434 RepID=UPI0026F3A32F|nr:uncharacterized protein LOC131428922 [Malaya genurostris]
MGLISHLTIHGKIIMQELHKELTDWDEEIPRHLEDRWKQWLQLMEGAEKLKIPRWIINKQTKQIELHTFVDASEDAYAAASYIRGIDDFGQTTCVRLIAGKARVAPIRKLSIPKLELQAALLGTRLMETILKELRIKPTKSLMWCDSQVVLSWINSDHRKYNTFVANRVGEILEITSMDQWRHVPTKMNPADAGTKLSPNISIWISGPEFLKQPEGQWPKTNLPHGTTEEIKNTVLVHYYEDAELDFIQENRYSNWEALLYHTCILKKFADWTRDRKGFVRNVSLKDRQVAESAIIRKAQWDIFTSEMEELSRYGVLNKPSKLTSLNPYLDEYGVMRANGRLDKANFLPIYTRRPIVLPPKHHVTRLIIKMYHEKYLHQADNTVVAAIHQKYFIQFGRAMLKRIKINCQKCKNIRAKPTPPQMANLPKGRLDIYAHPFTHTGVDYFGPFEVAVKRSIEKRWGVIFTCLSTRASHIELAEKLDTDAFLVCLRNFQHRRGKIKHLYSDNGTNFVGAEKEMHSLLKEINITMDKKEAAKLEIGWSFNPPSAPHFGGVWERLIRIIKNCIYEVLNTCGERRPQVETLRSALIQAEFMLNSRPLTDIAIDGIDDEVLTPFHFLIGRAGEYVPPFDPAQQELTTKQWKMVQHYSRHFWNKWKKEYIPTLLKRNKWTGKIVPIKVNDIVVIADDNIPHGKWLKGRVIETHVAADGQVRSVMIQTVKGIYKRPAVNVAILDVRRDEEEQNNETSTVIMNYHQEILPETNKRKFEKIRQFDPHAIEPIQAPGKILIDESDPSIMEKAAINFASWGKRQKIDIDAVKGMRDKAMKHKNGHLKKKSLV